MDNRSYGAMQSINGPSLGGGLNTAMQSARTDTPPESESKIRNVVGMTEELLQTMHASISHLESRLDTVLTPIPPQPATSVDAKNIRQPLSHLCERTASVNLSMSEAITRLQSLRDRIEV